MVRGRGLVGATKANSSGLPRGTEGVNVGGRACVLVHVERAERESGLMADIWHPVPPVWVLQPRTPSRPLTERRDRPHKIGTLPRSKPPRTPCPAPPSRPPSATPPGGAGKESLFQQHRHQLMCQFVFQSAPRKNLSPCSAAVGKN